MLFVYRSNRLERLADALAEVIKDPLSSPLAPEWICVQTQGVGTWLSMALSERFGVWANGHHPFPRAVIETLLFSTLENSETERFWSNTNALAWGIMAILPDFLNRPEFFSLKHYLDDDPHGVKRYQLAYRIARAFDQYAVYRPDRVMAWEAGKEDALPLAQRWQPILWRALWQQINSLHTAGVFSGYLSAMADGRVRFDELPQRLCFFSLSTLPPLYVRALEALPPSFPVHLFMLSPSREFWADVRSPKEIYQAALKETVRGKPSDTALYLEEGHPLLARLGHLGREFQTILEENTDYVEPWPDLYEDPAPEETGDMLFVLQSDILNLRLRKKGGAPALPISPDDQSIQVHVCHSPMREMQVLRDQLIDLLEKDAGLQPHDIVVMAPDIDTYAPFIEAVFGVDDRAVHAIPYALGDRSLLQDAPVVRALMALVRLARSRLSSQEVVDFLAQEVVRERFELSEAEMALAVGWINEAGIRWGLDRNHRAVVGQPALEENTWRFGMDRLLMGVAMPHDHTLLFKEVLAYTNIEGKESETLGKLAAFWYDLSEIWQQFQAPHTALEWQQAVLTAVSKLVILRPDTEDQHQSLRQAFQSLSDESLRAGFEDRFHLDVLSQWLSDWVRRHAHGRGFLSGGVTFCHLLPMRSIPFRVVYLLGMNDADFPRRQPSPGFDLTALSPRPGDRSVRKDDRYLFLEALLSARSRFIVSYIGRDIRDNSPKPPSVVVDDLLDTLCDGFFLETTPANHPSKNPPLRDHLITQHPLHPFHVDYFLPGSKRLFSYSSSYLAGAVAGAGAKGSRQPFMDASLSRFDEGPFVIRMEDLVQFYSMPARFFLTHRLGISLGEETASLGLREPLVPEALERYEIRAFLLKEILAGKAPDGLYVRLRADGRLPLGRAGQAFFEDMVAEVQPIVDKVKPIQTLDRLSPLGVDLEINGVRIWGGIENRWPGQRLLVNAGALTVTRKMGCWIEHLILNALGETDGPGRSLLVGKGSRGVDVIEFEPVPEMAAQWLSELVSLFKAGITAPLRFFPKASHAFAEVLSLGDGPQQRAKARQAAQRSFHGGDWALPGEGADPSVQRVFDTTDPLIDLPEEDEFSFQRLAWRVFSPMFTAMGKGPTETSGRRHP